MAGTNQKELAKIIPEDNEGPVFIHSDVSRASVFVKPTLKRETTLEKHMLFLQSLLGERMIWFPSFNYQFLKIKVFNPQKAICELGPLPEYFRSKLATWRTIEPVFSASGIGQNPCRNIAPRIVRAFDEESIFGKLVYQNGLLLFYGVGFSVATIIHYVESIVEPLYRYDKKFNGTIVTRGRVDQITYIYHVRPKGFHLDYGWNRLLTDLIELDIAKTTKNCFATVVRARDLTDFWVDRLEEDPYYLLDEASRMWVIPKVEKVGRRFEIADFE